MVFFAMKDVSDAMGAMIIFLCLFSSVSCWLATGWPWLGLCDHFGSYQIYYGYSMIALLVALFHFLHGYMLWVRSFCNVLMPIIRNFEYSPFSKVSFI